MRRARRRTTMYERSRRSRKAAGLHGDSAGTQAQSRTVSQGLARTHECLSKLITSDTVAQARSRTGAPEDVGWVGFDKLCIARQEQLTPDLGVLRVLEEQNFTHLFVSGMRTGVSRAAPHIDIGN